MVLLTTMAIGWPERARPVAERTPVETRTPTALRGPILDDSTEDPGLTVRTNDR